MAFRDDFHIFKNNPGLVYLDNAATTQKPFSVVEKLKEFYEKDNANVHRGTYELSQRAGREYDQARLILADFIGAVPEEIIFTRNTSESINLLSYTIESLVQDGRDEIVLTEMEHHSNLVPWQQLSKRNGWKIKFIKMMDNFTLDYDDAREKINSRTALASFCQISNSLGTINDVKNLCAISRDRGAISIIDAAQSVAHLEIDVKKIDCDFLAFSGHKMYGPLGIGVLYGKKEMLKKLQPFLYGGDMISSVSFYNAEWNKIPEKFEAGTQDIGGVIALAEAVRYVKSVGIGEIGKLEKELTRYSLAKLNQIEGIKIYHPGIDKGSSIISFNIGEIHPHDISFMLNNFKICVRAGHHCTMPLMERLGLAGTLRASFAIYNTKEDSDKLVDSLKEIVKIL